MYISKELHDAVCEAGVYGIALVLGFCLLAIVFPYIVRALRRVRRRVGLWLGYRLDVARIRRDARRYKAAMRVFDEPLRNWRPSGDTRARY